MNNVQMAGIQDIDEITKLFCSSFGESEEAVASFYKNAVLNENILVAKNEQSVSGMLHLLPALITFEAKTYPCGYVYALAVDKEYRHQGIMTALERSASQYAVENGIGTLFLVPQTRCLFKMYENIGYKTVAYREETVVVPEYIKDFSLSKCEKDVFFARRKSLLSKKASFFDLKEKASEYRFIQANEIGEVLFYRESNASGYMVLLSDKDKCIIKETDLPFGAVSKAAYALMTANTGIKTVSLHGVGRRSPFAMAKSLDGKVNVFDLMRANPYCALMLE